MTAADLLTRMQILDNELEIAAAGDDETRALAALDMAQDYFESVAASMPIIGQTKSDVVTVANTETTAWPATLLRVDSVWYVDPATSRPAWELKLLDGPGDHIGSSPFPLNLVTTTGTGKPYGYSYDSEYFYWSPLPDAAHTLRVYGLVSKTNLTTRAVTFGWPDGVSVPIAAFACRLLEMGIDDPADELQALAEEAFVPVLRRMRKANRQEPRGRHYTRTHYT